MNETIRKSIIDKLGHIEQSYEVKIPLAIESGSRGWGFASANADYDCRFIYVSKPKKYLSILEMDEFIEYELDETYDIKGYDLKRVLKYIMKSQATISEWLSSDVVYIKDCSITNKLAKLAADFFNPISVSHHYLSLAKKMMADITSADEAKIKKYFYILRPIANLNYIESLFSISIPPSFQQICPSLALAKNDRTFGYARFRQAPILNKLCSKI